MLFRNELLLFIGRVCGVLLSFALAFFIAGRASSLFLLKLVRTLHRTSIVLVIVVNCWVLMTGSWSLLQLLVALSDRRATWSPEAVAAMIGSSI
jgi:hypothetical protein